MLHKIETFYRLILLTLISALFILPFIINSNLNTIPLHSSFIRDIMSIITLTLIITLGICKNIFSQSIKIPNILLYLIPIVLFCGIQFTLIKPNYTAPYLDVMSSFTLITVAILILYNSNIPLQLIQTIIAFSIIITCYLQITFSILQLINYQLEYKLLFYGFTEPYYALVNIFKISDDGRITGGIGQPNLLADILSWGIIANIYLFNQRNKHKPYLFWSNLIITSIFITLTHSNTAYLYSVVLFIYSICLLKFKSNQSNIHYSYKLLCSSLILMLVILTYNVIIKYNLLGYLDTNHLTNAYKQIATTKPHDINSHDRLIMWGRAWMMFIQHPLIGVGWNQYLQYFLITPTPSFLYSTVGEMAAYENCHNLILQLLATTGIFGTLIFMALILYIIQHLAKQEIKNQILPLGIALIVLTHSMFEYPLFNVAILIPILIITTTYDRKYFILNPKYKTIFLSITGILITLVWWQIFVGINSFLLLSQIKKPTKYEINNQPYNVLNVYFATANNPYWDAAADSVLTQNLLYSVRTPQNMQYFDLTYAVISRSSIYYPNPSFLLRLAVLDTVLGKKEKAQAEVNLVLNNYGKFESDFKIFFNAASSHDNNLNKKLLELLPK